MSFEREKLRPQKSAAPAEGHRAVPMSWEAEQGVMGSLLLNPVEVARALEERGVTREWFHVPAHQIVLDYVLAMIAAPMAVDMVTLTQALADGGVFETVGGGDMVLKLWQAVPTPANVGWYLDILAEKFAARQLLEVCTQFAARLYEEQDRIGELIDEAQVAMLAVNRPDSTGTETIAHIRPAVIEAVNAIEETYHHRGGVVGLATGYHQIDRMTGGLKKGQLIVPAARPSMGKSAFLGGIIEHVALQIRKPVLLFSLEMNATEWAARMVCGLAGVNLQRVRDGYLSRIQVEEKLPRVVEEVGLAPIYIDETPAISIQDLRVRARRFVRAHPDTAAIFVDYLQLMRSTTKRAQDNRVLELGEISGGLKRLARELELPVFAAAQLNRENDGPKNVPKLSNLRESGSIEQDADVVFLLHRPEQYQPDNEEYKGKAIVMLAKQRNGPTGEIKLAFKKELGRFENPEGQELYSNDPTKRQGAGATGDNQEESDD